MRNLAIIALLFIGASDPPDSVMMKTASREIVIEQNKEMQQDIDTLKIMIQELTDKLQAKKDTIK